MKITYNKDNKGSVKIVFVKDDKLNNDANCFNIKLLEKYNNRTFIKFMRKIIRNAIDNNINNLSINWKDILNIEIKDEEIYNNLWKAKVLMENIILAHYEFDKYKSKKNNIINNVNINGSITDMELKEMRIGEIIGESVNISRDLANTPANDMTPTILANFTKSLFKNTKVKVQILGEKEAKKLNMGLFMAVGSGSIEESKLIVCEYMNGNKNDKPVVLIGKGITYDTGGLNLKLKSMEEMIMDMSGGASVISALYSANKLNIKKNIIAIVPAVENAISGSSYRPGDVIKSMSGITVEIGNTDAEGRLVLADAITFSNKYHPKIIIDVATLTGAAIMALGEHTTALMTDDNSLESLIRNMGEWTGDIVWPLPLWEEYSEYMKSNIADINNVSSKWTGAGTITAAMFLKKFIDKCDKDIRWAHLDMAPRMTSVVGDNLGYGSSGEPVRLLIEILRRA